MSYPEHTKLRAVKDQTQAAGDFLAWLREEKGYALVDQQDHYITETPEDLLAEWQGISRVILEQEKRAMLNELQIGET